MSRVYESNGPDVKIRGNPAHIAEKYIQLARDAQSSGDPVSAENYFQHAEHYYRLIAAAQEQFRQNNPHLPRPDSEIPSARDDAFDDGDDDGVQQSNAGPSDTPFGTREPQPFLPREPYPQAQQQPQAPRPQQGGGLEGGGEIDRLPSFITGGQQPQHQPQQGQQTNPGYVQGNGHDNQGDRFPLHRRRRRHRGGGPRPDMNQGQGGNRDEPPSHGD